MLIKPSIDSLLKKVDNKYTLVVVAAKRAREIKNGDLSQVLQERQEQQQDAFVKEVTIALEEIDRGIISYRRSQSNG